MKDDKTTLGECDKLSKATEGNPMTEAAIGKKMKALNAQYKAADNAYRKALQSKSVDVSNKLKSLIDQAGKLGDAPDSSDKKTMNSLVKQWKDTQVTADNVADATRRCPVCKMWWARSARPRPTRIMRRRRRRRPRGRPRRKLRLRRNSSSNPSRRIRRNANTRTLIRRNGSTQLQGNSSPRHPRRLLRPHRPNRLRVAMETVA